MPNNSDTGEIMALARDMLKIERRQDAASLAPFLHDEYVGVDPSGALITKEMSLARYRRADFKLEELDVSTVSVTSLNAAALEIGIMTMRGRLGEFIFGGCYRYTHVWVSNDGAWQVRASQLTPTRE